MSDNELGQLHLGTNTFMHELDHQFLHGGMTSTPPDVNVPMTPILANMGALEDFAPMSNSLDQDGENSFLSLATSNGQMELDMSNVLDFMTPPTLSHESLGSSSKGMPGLLRMDSHHQIFHGFGSTMLETRSISPFYSQGPDGGFPPSNQALSLPEPEAVVACLDSWALFRCNPMPKWTTSPPKTAKIYLEGLAQTLRSQDTWKSWDPCLDNADQGFEHKISAEPIVGWPREKLIAITQGFLHKALDIHRAVPPSREGSPGSPDPHNPGFLMLPPPHVIQYFLRSYVIQHEPYYACNPAGGLDPNNLMQGSNSKASSLLILLMVAHGAAASSSIEARYLSSGLTEACRISLFDIIEKDVYLARDPLVLRSALLFTTLAAWSGDKWHMDVSVSIGCRKSSHANRLFRLRLVSEGCILL